MFAALGTECSCEAFIRPVDVLIVAYLTTLSFSFTFVSFSPLVVFQMIILVQTHQNLLYVFILFYICLFTFVFGQ